MREIAARMREAATKVGTISALWDVVFDAEAILTGEVSWADRKTVERSLEAWTGTGAGIRWLNRPKPATSAARNTSWALGPIQLKNFPDRLLGRGISCGRNLPVGFIHLPAPARPLRSGRPIFVLDCFLRAVMPLSLTPYSFTRRVFWRLGLPPRRRLIMRASHASRSEKRQ